MDSPEFVGRKGIYGGLLAFVNKLFQNLRPISSKRGFRGCPWNYDLHHYCL